MSFTVIETIENALKVIGVLDSAQPLQSRDRTTTLQALNSMARHWQTQYGHLWLQGYGALLCEKDKQSYKLGAGGDRFVNIVDLLTPTLSAAASSGATVVSVSSASGAADNDNIGVYLSTGAFHWTTIASISGSEITLASALPEDAANNAQVYIYTTEAERPLKINFATYAYNLSSSEIPLHKLGRQEYIEQPQKSTSGSVNEFYFQPTLNLATLYLWPVSDTNLGIIRASYTTPFTELVSNDDEVQFPDEWEDAVIFGLASRIMDEYGLPEQKQAVIQSKADRYLSDCLAFDNENADLHIEPDYR